MVSWETNEEPVEAAVIEAASGAAGIGAVAGLAVLLPMEAGIPVPLPADLVMLTVGARVGAGDIPLWVAVLAFEAIAAIGTAALFLLVRGPGHGFVVRVGPRIGLSDSRLERASAPSRAARNARTRYRSRNAWAPDPYRRRCWRHWPVYSPSLAAAGNREQHLLATASLLGLLPRRCGSSGTPGGYRAGPGTDRRRDTGRSHLLDCSSGTTRRCRGSGRGRVSGVLTISVAVRATPRVQGAYRDPSDGSAESLSRQETGKSPVSPTWRRYGAPSALLGVSTSSNRGHRYPVPTEVFAPPALPEPASALQLINAGDGSDPWDGTRPVGLLPPPRP